MTPVAVVFDDVCTEGIFLALYITADAYDFTILSKSITTKEG